MFSFFVFYVNIECLNQVREYFPCSTQAAELQNYFKLWVPNGFTMYLIYLGSSSSKGTLA